MYTNIVEYNKKLHHVQSSVLDTLRHATRARYSELLRPTRLESDIFKYHLRKLVQMKYVSKADDGMYELTAEGKEFANQIDEKTGLEIQQPKASMLMVVRSEKNDETYYLAHKRTREPFRDFWGIASAPMLRGVPIADSASRELRKQTGINAMFVPVGLYRVIDTLSTGQVLEDKLFTLLVADVNDCPEPRYWSGGESMWLTKQQLLEQAPLFSTTARTLTMVEERQQFAEDTCIYSREEY